MKNLIKRLIPKRIRVIILKIYYSLKNFWLNTIDMLPGMRDELTPPRRMIFVGGGNFKKIGEGLVQHFIEVVKLKPNESVLDVGCGIGRIAASLTKYLNESGSYEGFDIVPDGINWCKKNISSKYPNFNFQLADVFNKMYHPGGKYKASEYKFPYENNSFDFVFLTSVFTHMLPEDMENYFCEIVRVLKKKGRCFITFFLLNKESLQLINEGKSTLDFKYDLEKYRIIDENTPEAAVGYKEEYIHSIYEKLGLKLVEPIGYGSWCGKSNSSGYQDSIMAIKN